MKITATDHDAEGNVTDRGYPHYAYDEDSARTFMVIQAGMMAQAGGYTVAEVEPRRVRLEKRDGSGGTTFEVEPT